MVATHDFFIWLMNTMVRTARTAGAVGCWFGEEGTKGCDFQSYDLGR